MTRLQIAKMYFYKFLSCITIGKTKDYFRKKCNRKLKKIYPYRKTFNSQISDNLIEKNDCLDRKISYSQSGEDLIIGILINKYRREKYLWLDIGAHDPELLSNTKFFYELGFCGINIEGDSSLITKFHEERPRDINLNILAGESSGEGTFYLIDPPALNTMSETEAKKYESLGHKILDIVTVPTLRVDNIIEKYADGHFPPILFLDAEGFDFNILQTINFDKARPDIICVEIIEYGSDFADNFEYILSSNIYKYLIKKGYYVYAITPINVIFHDRTVP